MTPRPKGPRDEGAPTDRQASSKGDPPVPAFHKSASAAAVLWSLAILWLLSGQAATHPEVHRLLLALAISSSIIVAADRHAAQLAAVAAVSYRAGAAERDRV